MNVRARVSGVVAALTAAVLLAGCGSPGPAVPDLSGPLPAGPFPAISTGDLPDAAPGEVHLFGLNDFHGNLEPPTGTNGHIGPYETGGAAYLAAHLARLRAKYPAGAVLAAGDDVGASPLTSALFHDEPTVDFLNSIGVAASSVGNHEFDHGVTELARLQHGGCAADGCTPGPRFTGAAFRYLAANVTDPAGNPPPGTTPWTIVDVGGHKIGVVGTVTPDTASIVLPDGIRGYTFADETDAINAAVPAMKQAGAETVVALLHDGGAQNTHGGPVDPNGCTDISPTVTALAHRVDPAVKVLITGHTHQWYNCAIDGKVVTQAASYGRMITDIALRFHDGTVDAKAVNRLVTHNLAPDPATAKTVAYYAGLADPRAKQTIGTATAPLPVESSPGGDSPLGDVIADSMLAAMAPQGAVAAFMNPGGVRAELSDGPISYAAAYAVQPFGNEVVAVTLTGRQILALLEQQWDNVSKPAVLDIAGLTYTYDDSAPKGARVLQDSVRIGDAPLNPAAEYKVATNSFLQAGGDGFAVFREATGTADIGPADLDALAAYLKSAGPIGAPPPRVQRR
ncbi:bifunctional metallophosphatase/5'-nucleotidase [Nocardia stercoris]|uniref:Bifunctional metallophosphatase/5'-nucleotidase n=1 Tax=Nocardia stercoris TaxID=2483361 RepID=A0A3M2L3A5_9NOCA|nr:5'-nucleotidase C-terminal domain-containing protein [Nocardia stercoris]RMI32182.1 bifunctional metallophosphatase/5'-nucleotidase [Nocardia stercoris]